MSVNIQENGQLKEIAGSGGGGGSNPEIEAKLAELELLIEQTQALRADLENYGMVKLSNSSAVTENVGLALPATEKNASIEGTLANQIASMNTNDKLAWKSRYTNPTISQYSHIEEKKIFYLAIEINPAYSTDSTYDDDFIFRISASQGYTRVNLIEETIHINKHYDFCGAIGYKHKDAQVEAPKACIFQKSEKKYLVICQVFGTTYSWAGVTIYAPNNNSNVTTWESQSVFTNPIYIAGNIWKADGEKVKEGWVVNSDDIISGITNAEELWSKDGVFVPSVFLAT